MEAGERCAGDAAASSLGDAGGDEGVGGSEGKCGRGGWAVTESLDGRDDRR